MSLKTLLDTTAIVRSARSGASTPAEREKALTELQRRGGKPAVDPRSDAKLAETAKADAEAEAKVLSPAEKALASTLEGVKREADKLEGSAIPRVADAVLLYLNERQRLSGNAQITLELKTLRSHCYDISGYNAAKVGANGMPLNNRSFESCVERGIMAAIVMFEAKVPGMKIEHDDKGRATKIVAPHNALAPRVKVDTGVSGKKVEVDNPDKTEMTVPVRVIEAKFRELHPAAKGKRAAHKNNTKAPAPAKKLEELAGTSIGVLASALTAKVKKMTKAPEGAEGEALVSLFMELGKLYQDDGTVTKAA